MKLIRIKDGDNFIYKDKRGKTIDDTETIDIIKKNRIPPAYTNVEIDTNPSSKVFATGYDDKQRKQYIYNKSFSEKKQAEKFCKMKTVALAMPKLQKSLRRNLAQKKINKKKLIAILIKVMAECNFRLGNEKYVELYNSYGISTILVEHLIVEGNNFTIRFVGKKGVVNNCIVHNKELVEYLKSIAVGKEPKDRLFTYIKNGELRALQPKEINNYLRRYGNITSKDFRTYTVNVMFIDELRKNGDGIPEKITHRKKLMKRIIEKIATELHHTPAICKKSYLDKNLYNMLLEKPNKLKRIIMKDFRGNRKYTAAEQGYISYLKRCRQS